MVNGENELQWLNDKVHETEAIERFDSNDLAFPKTDSVTKTLSKELEEEAGVKMDWSGAEEIYKGYVDDPRNTDNAWMETSVAHIHLTGDVANKLEMKAGDDAVDVGWHEINEDFLDHSLQKRRTWVHKRIVKALQTVKWSYLFQTLHQYNSRHFRSPEAVQLFNRFA